jgi:hypothetical protein
VVDLFGPHAQEPARLDRDILTIVAKAFDRDRAILIGAPELCNLERGVDAGPVDLGR